MCPLASNGAGPGRAGPGWDGPVQLDIGCLAVWCWNVVQQQSVSCTSGTTVGSSPPKRTNIQQWWIHVNDLLISYHWQVYIQSTSISDDSPEIVIGGATYKCINGEPLRSKSSLVDQINTIRHNTIHTIPHHPHHIIPYHTRHLHTYAATPTHLHQHMSTSR